ncbi:MAG: TonB-dependent receptor [Comamonadaceae bacterium SCN 68-20]|nr:MAG: TonB-dependent receptor [Comamonadaceae bacterium SCN 68-20]OJX29935.1 MAG: TonB-dependent receptor [Burkholderiales bacterium 68-20]UJB64061.1 TonB-dependent siderophore receptor [Acidovorax sp. YS12]
MRSPATLPHTLRLRGVAHAAMAAALALQLQCAAAQTARFDIPAQPLAPALAALAAQAGLQLAFAPELAAGRQAPAVQGTHDVADALRALLAGSGLQGRVQGRTLVVERPARTGATLDEVTVRASTEPESATGPLRGYAARRSATGTKTDTPILETPQSLSVVGAEEIETLKAQSLQDALGYVAGISRTEGLDRTTDGIFLRGFQSSNVGTYLRDGTPYTVNYYNGRQEPYGLERIEVLKGAASVLYGASAPGGIINTVSKRPTTERLRELNLELGSFARKQVSGDFGGALDADGEWSYRLTFLARESDSFINHVPDDRTYFAPALKWQPSARTSLTLLGEYHQDKTAYVYGLPGPGTVLPNANGPMPRNLYTGEPGYDKFHLTRYSVGYLLEHAFNERFTLRHNLRYYHAQNAYNNAGIWGLASDQRTTLDRDAQDRWDRSSATNIDTSLQYQGTHGSVQHTALIGFDYSTPRHETERYNRSGKPLDYYAPVYGQPLGPAVPAGNSSTLQTKRMGLYLQDQMKIGEKWVLLLGGRYDTLRYDERAFFTGEKWADGEKSNAFTGRAGLVYLGEGGVAPFLSYSESYEPTEGRDREGRRFKPTTGTQIEAGVRWQPPGADTLVSAAVYQLTRDNLTVTDPEDPNYAIQHGRVRSRGAELEARTRVGRNAHLIAAYAYTDARTVRASPLQPAQEGARSIAVPYHQVSLWADYDFGAFGLPGLKVGAGVRHMGEARGMAHGTPVSVPSFTLFDAMVGYHTGPWRFALNLSNLADKTYIGSCAMYGCFYGEPRKLIGTATYRW